jgi:DNA polymerase III epsilon subunit-like protein
MVVFTVIDTETNGIDEKSDILSIGWCTVSIDRNKEFSITNMNERLIKNNEIHNSEFAFAINHITDEDRELKGFSINEVLDELNDVCLNSGKLIYAYNASFDIKMIKKYREGFFENFIIHDAMSNKYEKLTNVIQRISWEYFHSPHYSLPITFHSASYDSYAAGIAILHNIYNIDCRELFEYNENNFFKCCFKGHNDEDIRKYASENKGCFKKFPLNSFYFKYLKEYLDLN